MRRALAVVAAHAALLASSALFAADFPIGAQDSIWNAPGFNGKWTGENWRMPTRTVNGTFLETKTAFFTNTTSVIDLDGASPVAYSFRFPYSTPASPADVSLSNGTLTFNGFISGDGANRQFQDMTVRAGAGAKIVNANATSGVVLNHNSHLVLENGATLTETATDQSDSKGSVGRNSESGVSNSLYIASGAKFTTGRHLLVGGSDSADSSPTGVVSVAGAGSLLDAQEIWLCYNDGKYASGGYGGLFVTDGARVVSRSTFLMGTDYTTADDIYRGVSEILVSGEGSSLELMGPLSMREYGTKRITVENGGRLSVADRIRSYADNAQIHALDIVVRNGGILEFGNISFNDHDSTRTYPGQGNSSFTVDGGITRALNSFTGKTGNSSEIFHPVTIGPNGWIFDTQNFDVIWTRTINFGTGTFTKIGSGFFEFSWVPKFPGRIDVTEGMVGLNGSTAKFPGEIIVRSGAAFKKTVAFSSEQDASFTLEAGSVLQPYQSSASAAPTAIQAQSFALPETGRVTIRLGDAGANTVPAGRYNLLTILGDGVFKEADLAKFAVASGAPGTLLLSDDAKTIAFDAANVSSKIWTGATGDGKFATGGNWLDGAAPSGGEDLFFLAGGEIENNLGSLAVSSITFGPNISETTVSGGEFTNVGAVTNLSSSVNPAIDAPVRFKGDISVKQNAVSYEARANSHVYFNGGAYAAAGCTNSAALSRAIYGHYYFDNTEETPPFTATTQGSNNRYGVMENSSLVVPYAGAMTELYIGNGGAFTAGVMRTTGRLGWQNWGEYVITNVLEVTASGDLYSGWSAGVDAPNVFKIEKAVNNISGSKSLFFAEGNSASDMTVFVGKGGITYTGTAGAFCFGKDAAGNRATLRPWYGDFAIESGSGRSDLEVACYRNVEFNTDDENGFGRTITVNGRLYFTATPDFTISGSGRVLVNRSANNGTQPPVTVKDTATLAFGAGGLSLTTSGAVAFHGGTTLQLPAASTENSNAVKLGGSLSVAGEGNVTLKLGEGTETLAPGKYPVFYVSGSIAPGALDRFVLANPTEGGVAYNYNIGSGDGLVSVYIGDTPPSSEYACLWTGLGGDNKFSTAANWQGGRRPQDIGSQAEVYFNTGSGEIVNDVDDLSVKAITFGKSIQAKITLSGKPISGVTSVRNVSTAFHPEVALKVNCATTVNVLPDGGYILFSGGIEGTTPASHTAYYGNYTLTADTWTPASSSSIPAGSVVAAKALSNPNNLTVAAGGKLVADSISSENNRTFAQNNGEIVIGGMIELKNKDSYFYNSNSSGLLRMGGISINQTASASGKSWVRLGPASGSNPFTVEVGAGGFGYASGTHSDSRYHLTWDSTRKQAVVAYAAEDFTLAPHPNNAARSFTTDTGSYIDLYTNPYDDYNSGRVEPKTITVAGVIQSSGGMSVYGTGTAIFTGASTFAGGMNVYDSATLAIAAGAKAGSGAVTLNHTSRLFLPDAGTGAATVGGALTFNAGTALVVSNLTDSVTPLTVGSVAGSGAAIEVDGDAPLADGVYTIFALASGTLADTVPAMFTLGGSAVAGKNASLGTSGGSLVLTVDGEGSPVQPAVSAWVWTGGGENANFSNPANWQGGVVPQAGVAKPIYFPAASGAIENDIPGLTPSSIVFGAVIGEVSISGKTFTGVESMENKSSTVTPVMNARVEFSGNIQFTTTATINSSTDYSVSGATIDFAGGASGLKIAGGSKQNVLKGVFERNDPSSGFASSSGGANRIMIRPGSTVTATAADCGNTHELFIMQDASLIVSNKTVSADQRAWCWNMGKFIVLDTYSLAYNGNHYLGYTGDTVSYGFNSQNLGSLWAKKIILDGTAGQVLWLGNNSASATYKDTAYDIYIGEGGLQFGASSQGTYATPVYCIAKLHPWGSDFTIMSRPTGHASGLSHRAEFYTNGDTEFVTTDADGETPRTITMDGIFRQNGSEAGSLVISGNGTFVQNGEMTETTKRTGALEVKDTATLKFGNSAAFIGTGPVTMVAGTTLALPLAAPGVDPVALGSSFAVSGEGKVKLVIGDGSELPAGDYALFTLSGGAAAEDASAAFDLQNAISAAAEFYVVNGKDLRLSVGGVLQNCVWTGAGDGVHFNDADNWSPAFVPANGSDLVFPSASATLVNDIAGFAAKSITFGEGIAGDVTISGNAISGVFAVTNLSTAANVTLANPVEYAPGVKMELYQAGKFHNSGTAFDEKGYVIFEGGVTGDELISNTSGSCNVFAGHWTRTSAAPYAHAKSQNGDYRQAIYPGSSLTVGSADYTKELRIGEGGAFTAATVTVALADSQRLSLRNYGEYVVTECLTVNGSTKKDLYTGFLPGNDVWKFEKIKLDQTSGYTIYLACNSSASQGTFFIGKGGIEFGEGNSRFGIGYNAADDSQTIRPWYSDFTITHGTGNSAEEFHAFRDVVFCTDDEKGVGRTITLNARPKFNNTPTFTVSGSGTLVVNSIHNNATQPPVTVKDTATLKFGNATAAISTAAHTFHAGTTLAVPEVATDAAPVALGSALAFEGDGQVKLVIGDGSTLADGDYPVLSTTGTLPTGFATTLALQNATESAARLYSTDGRTLRLAVGEVAAYSGPVCYWTGKAGDGKFSTAGNWLGGVKPAAAEPIVFDAAAAATIDNDIGDLAPASVTFSQNCAPVTIASQAGYAFSAVAAVTNSSPSVQTLGVPVAFSGTYRVHSEVAEVDFAGGATATAPDSSITSDTLASHTLKGNITFTADWTIANQPAGKPFVIASGSTVTGQNLAASSYQASNYHLRVEEGGVGSFYDINVDGKLVFKVDGRLVARRYVKVNGGDKNTPGRVLGYSGGNSGSLEGLSIYKSTTGYGYVDVYMPKMVVGGEGDQGFGMYRKDYCFRLFVDAELTAQDNFTVYQPISGDGPKDGDWGVNLNGKTLTVDTAGHTVVFDSYVHEADGSIVKKGEGEMTMKSRQKRYRGGTVVKGGTLTVALTGAVGSGPMAVESGATLKIASTSVSLPAALSVEGGATLALPLVASSAAPVSLGTAFEKTGEGKAKIVLGDGSAIADGDYPVATTGVLPNEVNDVFELVNETSSDVRFYTPDRNTLRVAVGTSVELGACVWIGAAGDGKFSTAGNWYDGNVPGNGSSIVFAADEMGSAENDLGDLQIDSVTFAAGSAPLGIEGGKFTLVKAVTNLASSVQSFYNEVEFAGEMLCVQSGYAVSFLGGAKATRPASAMRTSSSSDTARTLRGKFTFTDDWSVPGLGDGYDKPWIILSGSEVRGKLFTGTQTNRKRILKIDSGASAHFTVMTNGWSIGDIDVNGTLEVDGEVVVKTLSGDNGWSNLGTAGNTGTVKAERFVKIGNSYARSNIPNLTVGKGGLGCIVQDWRWQFDVNTTVKAGDNFEFLGLHNGSDWGIRISKNITLTIDVGEGKIVTLGCGVTSDTGGAGGAIKKTGAGLLVMNDVTGGTTGHTKSYSGGTTIEEGTVRFEAASFGTGAVTVKDGAVLELVPGSTLPSGNAVTLENGATLAAPESGAAAQIGGDATLGDGAILGLKFTDAGESPKFAFTSAPTLSGDVFVKIETAGGVLPRNRAGRWIVATGVGELDISKLKFDPVKAPKPTWVEDANPFLVEDGDLILKVKQPGFVFRIR